MSISSRSEAKQRLTFRTFISNSSFLFYRVSFRRKKKDSDAAKHKDDAKSPSGKKEAVSFLANVAVFRMNVRTHAISGFFQVCNSYEASYVR